MEVLKLQTWVSEFGDQINPDKVQEYLDFIIEARDRYDPERCSEWHHVIPKCIDHDKKFRDQGVQINGDDHFRAHRKLVDCFSTGDYKRRLGYALHMMMRGRQGRVEGVTPEEYEESKETFRKSVTGSKRSDETKKRLSETLGDGRLKGEGHPLYGKYLSEETKEKISQSIQRAWTPEKRLEFSIRRRGSGNPCYGKKINRPPITEESKSKMSESGKNKVWITNGVISTKIHKSENLPEGFCYGRTSFTRTSNGQEGKIWINNGKINKKIPADSDLPVGFVKGRVRRENKVS